MENAFVSEERVLSVETLPEFEPVVGAVAWDDEPTRAALRPNWSQRVLVVVVLAAAALVSSSGTALAPVGGVAVFVVLVALLTRAVFGRRDRRRIRAVLRSGQWQLINTVVLADMLGRDLSPWEAFLARGHKRGGVHLGDKVAAILDPATGDVRGTWLPFTRTHPWPGLDVRRWAWFVARPDGDAAIAPLDRSHIVGLRRGPGFGKALHDHAWNVLREADVPPAPGGRPIMPGDAGITHLPGEPERWPNRPMSTRSRVVIVALLASAALIMGMTDTIAHQDKIQRRDDLVESGIEARARVVAYRSNGRSSDLITIQLLDGPYEGFRGTRSVDQGPEARPGDVVTVFHASEDVNDLVIVGYDQDVRSTGWFLAVATLVVGIWLWSTHRRTQAGKATG